MGSEDWKIRAACRYWIKTCFSAIPTSLLEKAYGEWLDDIRILAPTPEQYTETCRDDCDKNISCDECGYECYYEEIPTIPMWSWVFVPDEYIDEVWIKEHAKEIWSKCGIIVYETDELGVYLGINGAGYNFYEAHWIPLYKLRGLKWHETLPDVVLEQFR